MKLAASWSSIAQDECEQMHRFGPGRTATWSKTHMAPKVPETLQPMVHEKGSADPWAASLAVAAKLPQAGAKRGACFGSNDKGSNHASDDMLFQQALPSTFIGLSHTVQKHGTNPKP